MSPTASHRPREIQMLDSCSMGERPAAGLEACASVELPQRLPSALEHPTLQRTRCLSSPHQHGTFSVGHCFSRNSPAKPQGKHQLQITLAQFN